MEFLTPVAGWALGKAADTVWSIATDQVPTKSQLIDIEQAIKAGLEAVRSWESSLEASQLLFKCCDDRQQRRFLEQAFTDSGVAEQLQRPLEGKGEPDITLLQEYFRRVADEVGVELTENSLQPWLKTFSDEYFDKTPPSIKFEVARRRYLNQLANWYDDVKFLGISVAGQEDTKSEKLLQIFVMPDLKERSSLRVSGLPPLENVQQSVEQNTLDSRQANLMTEQRQLLSRQAQKSKTLSAQALMKQNWPQRCVILGAPGSGKTTLMSYFAVALATGKAPNSLDISEDYLPILVRIRDWVRAPQEGILEYIYAFTTQKLAIKDLPSGFFEHWLNVGKALILLDGLDEVAKESCRDEVVKQIECFLQHEIYRQNPAIIASRPAGYKQAYFRTEEFPHYDLLPFDQPKIDAFIKNWYDNRFKDEEESQRRQRTLKQAVSNRDRIQVLAQNPLLLTIIALIHRYEAYLPRDRHQLYNRAVETLLTNWDANKELDYKWPLEYLRRDAVRRMMERLAYWIHSQGSVGDNNEGGTLIDYNELINQLSRFIAEEADIKRYQAVQEAKRFLNHIRHRTGLLNEQGPDCYAFVHKTFQEYLCAQDIKYRADEGYDFDIILTPVCDYLHAPHWKEVLLLLIAQQPRQRVATIIQQILDHPTPFEQWLHRNLFFAANCLAENVELADSQLINYILDALVKLQINKSSLVLRQQASKCLKSLSETSFQNAALQFLEAQYEQIEIIELQEFRFVLGKEAVAVENLVSLLKDDHIKDDLRSDAAEYLGQLGVKTDTVVQALQALLRENYIHLSYTALNTLKQLDSGRAAVQTLLVLVKDDDSRIRHSAVMQLCELSDTDDVMVQELLALLNHNDGYVRSYIAESLGKLEHASDAVVYGLLALLEDDDGSVRHCAAEALGILGNASDAVVQGLLVLLEDDEYISGFRWKVRGVAADSLLKLGFEGDSALQALQVLVKDGIYSIHSLAKALVGQGIELDVLVQALLALLKDDGKHTRSRAVSALEKLSEQTDSVVPALANWIEQNQQSEYVGHGIDALWVIVTEQAYRKIEYAEFEKRS